MGVAVVSGGGDPAATGAKQAQGAASTSGGGSGAAAARKGALVPATVTGGGPNSATATASQSPTMRGVREVIAHLLRLEVTNAQASAYALSSPTPPAFEVVRPEEIEYDLAMSRGLDRWHLVVRAHVAPTSDVGAQVNLDDLLQAIQRAIDSDPTLGLRAQDARVTRVRQLGPFVAEADVEVFVTGE